MKTCIRQALAFLLLAGLGSAQNPHVVSPSNGGTGVSGTKFAHVMAGVLACADSSGSGTVQVCATSPTFTPAAGDWIIYSTTTPNSGDVTINVNSLGAKHVRKWLASAVLASGDLPSGVKVPLYYDGTYWEIQAIGNAPVTAVSLIASGTSTMGTSAISSNACATVVTTSATGTLTTDNIAADFNADPTATTGYIPGAMLTIVKYPTADNVNFKVCNNTGSSITPSAVTLNWRVVRLVVGR